MEQLKQIEFDPRDPSLYEYVSASHPFMQEAYKEACKSGCGSRQVGAVIVEEGVIIASGHNSGNREQAPCPRVEQNLPSGVGYELCPHCDESDLIGHAEADTIKNAEINQVNIGGGGELYMFGHWWACEQCWEKIRAAGVNKIFLVENAAELFKQRGVLQEKMWYKNMEHKT